MRLYKGPATVLLLIFSWGAGNAWASGFYAGTGIHMEFADIGHEKDVRYHAGVLDAHPAGTYRVTRDSNEDSFHALSLSLGYRTALSGKLWFSGEIEGSVYSGTVRGYLEGSYRGDAVPIPSEQVFPGKWRVEKDHGYGLNAQLGYALGDHRSVYLVAGVQRLEATFHSAYDNQGSGAGAIRGEARRTRNATPWLIGAGMEFGSGPHRIDVCAHYSEWDMDVSVGDGATERSALVGYDFDVEEVGITLGYVRLF